MTLLIARKIPGKQESQPIEGVARITLLTTNGELSVVVTGMHNANGIFYPHLVRESRLTVGKDHMTLMLTCVVL
jgi:hypothetical protein